MMILTERLRSQIEEHMADEQAGFRKDRSTVQQILALRLIAEKARRKGLFKGNSSQNCKGNGKPEGLGQDLESKAITLETKLSILKTCVFSTMLYGCEHGQLQNAAKAESCPLRENATGRF